MRTSVLIVVLGLTCALPPTAFAGQRGTDRQQESRNEQTERITRRFRIGDNGRFILANMAGDITVTGGSGDEVAIEAVKRTRGSRAELDNVTVTFEERPGRVEVQTDYQRSRGRNGVSVDFTVSVPANTSVDVRSMSGSVRVDGVRGVVRSQTMSGDVVAVKSPRIEAAQTLSGTIDLSDTDVEGPLAVSTMSGDIRARGLKAGRLQLSTVSGEVQLTDVSSDRVEVKSMSGDITFGGALAPNGRYTINSHSGSIRLAVGTNVGFELNATSFSGTVRADIPVTLGGAPQPGRRGRGRSDGLIRAVFGDGSATLDVTTFSGDITLNRR